MSYLSVFAWNFDNPPGGVDLIRVAQASALGYGEIMRGTHDGRSSLAPGGNQDMQDNGPVHCTVGR